MAESAVKIAKRIIRKAKENKEDAFLAVLAHHNTISQGIGRSPAQRMFDRRTRTLLPMTRALLAPATAREDRTKLKERQEKQRMQYNRGAKDLKPLAEGDMVRMKPYILGDKVWKKGEITKQLDDRSYELLSEGKILRRNRVQLRPTRESTNVVPDNAQNTEEPQAVRLPTPIKSQPNQPKATKPGKCTEIIPVEDIPKANQGAESLTSDLKQPQREDTTIRRSRRQPQRPAYLKDFVEN